MKPVAQHRELKALVSDGRGNAVYRETFQPPTGLVNNEFLVQQTHFGYNYLDAQNLSSRPNSVIGVESCGVIRDRYTQKPVSDLKIGQRVYCLDLTYSGMGTSIEQRVYKLGMIVPIQDWVSPELAATTLKGVFSAHLLFDAYKARKGEFVVVNSAAGGVGSILSQMAQRNQGSNVIAVTGTPSKVDYIRENGLKHVLNWQDPDFKRQVAHIAGGKGVSCVFDGVGGNFSLKALSILRPKGILVNFGESSGTALKLDLATIQRKSLFFTTVRLEHYIQQYARLIMASWAYYENVRNGTLRPCITKFRFQDVNSALRQLKTGRTMGQVIAHISS